ncbi:keratin-associated protein 13-1-like [Oryx dammah]|uniref:keratin-associated protein 13-1-like n=1 Tax=Oryx dammah TaxID=59534 RepID=UPI001A9C04AB|nr:keratin-associated protein 13-1-like [Oryx dammah]
MSYNCCSGNFSSRSLRDHLHYSGSSYGSSFPSNLVYRTDLCSPSSCQLDSSLYSQETCCEPIRTQTVVSSPCQTSCYRPRTSTFFSPCQTTCSGSLGFSSSNFPSVGHVFPSLGFGSGGFQSVGHSPNIFSSLSCRSSFYRPTFFSSRSGRSLSFQPTCGSGFY